MRFEELKLHISDARIAHNIEYHSNHDPNWADWYVIHMTKYGLESNNAELSALLREADAAYQNESEQYPWENYIANYICENYK